MPTRLRSAGDLAHPTKFTPGEKRLIRRLRTPNLVQRYLNRLPYNMEAPGHDTLRSFRQVVRHRKAHCLEAALSAACILEQHGYSPLVMSLESIDRLDHVIFVYHQHGRWGAVARSRDPGLHGRKPVFRSLRALARSYFDPFIDSTGLLTAYALVDLRTLGGYDWRFAKRNMWAVERFLIQARHRQIKSSAARARKLRVRYNAYLARYGKKPLFYRGRATWTPIPKEFL